VWQALPVSGSSAGLAPEQPVETLGEVSSPGERTRRPWLAIGACSAAVLGVGGLDYLTGTEISFSIFYLIPVSAAVWWVGPRSGFLVAVLSAAVWMANEVVLGGKTYSHPMIPVWNSVMRLGVFLIVGGMLSRLLSIVAKERAARHELTDAYAALDHTRKQQLLFKDQLLSHVSHELRTPLTALHQFITIPLDGLLGPLNEEQKDSLGVALRNVKQLERLIRDLVESARAEAGKLTIEPVPTSVKQAVTELFRTLRSRAAEQEIALIDDFSPALPRVMADPGRLSQILINLFENALKFTPREGSVTVTGALDPKRPGVLTVCVADTGVGIEPKTMGRLFERLYQEEKGTRSSRSGLGLGLYICRELVVRQGGRMWVESEVGAGSRFFFTLPLAASSGSQAETRSAAT